MKSQYAKINATNPLLCYSYKMRKCNRMIANIFRKHLDEYEITDSQLSILFFVTKQEGVTQKKISDFLISEKSTINRNIRRLIEGGVISSENRSLNTTDKGKRLLEKIIPSWENAMKEVHDIIGNDGDEAFNFFYSKLKNQLC